MGWAWKASIAPNLYGDEMILFRTLRADGFKLPDGVSLRHPNDQVKNIADGLSEFGSISARYFIYIVQYLILQNNHLARHEDWRIISHTRPNSYPYPYPNRQTCITGSSLVICQFWRRTNFDSFLIYSPSSFSFPFARLDKKIYASFTPFSSLAILISFHVCRLIYIQMLSLKKILYYIVI